MLFPRLVSDTRDQYSLVSAASTSMKEQPLFPILSPSNPSDYKLLRFIDLAFPEHLGGEKEKRVNKTSLHP